MARKTVLERFTEKTREGEVLRPELGPCLEWVGAIDKGGYGRFGLCGTRVEYAHRAAWILACGEISDGKWVLHACDNRRCVRVGHLFLGDVFDNNRDRDRKGRARGRFAQKFSSEIVEQARRLAQAGVSLRSVGAMLGMSRHCAWRIATGRARR